MRAASDWFSKKENNMISDRNNKIQCAWRLEIIITVAVILLLLLLSCTRRDEMITRRVRSTRGYTTAVSRTTSSIIIGVRYHDQDWGSRTNGVEHYFYSCFASYLGQLSTAAADVRTGRKRHFSRDRYAHRGFIFCSEKTKRNNALAISSTDNVSRSRLYHNVHTSVVPRTAPGKDSVHIIHYYNIHYIHTILCEQYSSRSVWQVVVL